MVATVRAVKGEEYYEKEEFKQTKTKKGRKDVENYYSEDNQSKGVYFGTGSKKLGFEKAEDGHLQKLKKGINPNTDKQIYKASKSDKNFIDVTLSAPKDFSILAEIDSKNAKEYRAIFDRACEKAYEVMEQKTYRQYSRTKQKLYDTELIGIGYTHKTARPTDVRPDMQWHRHNLVSLVARTKDGEFRRLESYGLFNNQKLIGGVFRAELANGLREMGFGIEPCKELEEEDLKPTGKKTYVNSFKVVGISEEVRKNFSNRAEGINKIANANGKTTSLDKNNIAQNMKRQKVLYDPLELKMMWKSEANKLGLTPEKIESIKNDNDVTASNYLKLEDQIIQECFSKNGKLYESKLILKLVEQEQYTGLSAKDVYKNMIDAGLISRGQGFELNTTVKFENVNRNKQFIKSSNKAKGSSMAKKVINIFKTTKSNITKMPSLRKPLNDTLMDILIAEMIKMLGNKKKAPEKPTQQIATTKKEVNKPSSAFDVSAAKTLNSAIGEIDAKGMSIADIENELLRADISDERRWQLKTQLDKLYWEQGEAYKRAINTNPYKLVPPGYKD